MTNIQLSVAEKPCVASYSCTDSSFRIRLKLPQTYRIVAAYTALAYCNKMRDSVFAKISFNSSVIQHTTASVVAVVISYKIGTMGTGNANAGLTMGRCGYGSILPQRVSGGFFFFFFFFWFSLSAVAKQQVFGLHHLFALHRPDLLQLS